MYIELGSDFFYIKESLIIFIAYLKCSKVWIECSSCLLYFAILFMVKLHGTSTPSSLVSLLFFCSPSSIEAFTTIHNISHLNSTGQNTTGLDWYNPLLKVSKPDHFTIRNCAALVFD